MLCGQYLPGPIDPAPRNGSQRAVPSLERKTCQQPLIRHRIASYLSTPLVGSFTNTKIHQLHRPVGLTPCAYGSRGAVNAEPSLNWLGGTTPCSRMSASHGAKRCARPQSRSGNELTGEG